MAESKGFEPSIQYYPYTRLAGERLRPTRPTLHGDIKLDGGGGGIRTHGALSDSTVFKTASLNRSDTPPYMEPRLFWGSQLTIAKLLLFVNIYSLFLLFFILKRLFVNASGGIVVLEIVSPQNNCFIPVYFCKNSLSNAGPVSTRYPFCCAASSVKGQWGKLVFSVVER